MAELSASPVVNPRLKRIADALAQLQGPMGQIIPGTDYNPFQTFTPAASSVENWAYGNYPFAAPSGVTNRRLPIVKTGKERELNDLASVAMMATGLPAASRGVKRVADDTADALVQFVTKNPKATAPQVLEEAGQLVPLAQIAKIRGVPINEILFPGRTISELNQYEKKAVNKFEKSLANPAVQRREEMRLAGGDIIKPTPGLNLISEIALDPQTMVGKRVVPVFGDLSPIGGDVYQVGGVPLSKPVTQQAGRKYSLVDQNIAQGNAYASELNAAAGKQANFRKFGDDDVLGVFFGGGPNSADFSHHMAQSFVRQLDALKPDSDAISAFNEAVRNTPVEKAVPGSTKKVRTYPFQNFAGINSPNIEEMMVTRTTKDFTPGQLRTAIAQNVNTARFRDMGFPRYEDTQRVMTEAGLRPGYAGQTIFQAMPEKELIVPDYVHQSYSTGIPGKYLGGLNINAAETGVPAEKIFQNLFAEQRAKNKRDDQILAKMRMSHQGEMFTQQHADVLSEFLESLRR